MIVKAKNIVKTFKKQNFTLQNISLSVGKKEILGLIGPDGAGKSTLLKIIANVMDADEGELILFGEKIEKSKDYSHLKDKIAYMPQGLGLNLYQKLSIDENINFFAELKGLSIKEVEKRKERLLEITGLKKFRDRLVYKLSGGMKQKLGICCSLIHKPELIILDEPTIGVDPVSRRELWDLFMDFVNDENLSIIISTSYFDEAERCDKVIFLSNGKIQTYSKENIFVYEAEITSEDQISSFYKRYTGVRFKKNKIRFISKTAISNATKVPIQFEDYILTKMNTKYLNISFPKKGDTNKKEALTVTNISKYFKDFPALQNVSFSVKRGEVFGLLGPNGAGKTTLIKIITGLYNPTSGEYSIFGEKNIKNLKYEIGYMSQKFSLYNDLTVKENIEYYINIYKSKNLPLFSSIIQTIGLNRYFSTLVKNLPLGYKQRLALICSILHLPSIVFLDEPTSGVDPVERDVFWQLIHKLAKAGITVIVTTHYMSEAEYCDRIGLINHGKLIALDTPENLKIKLTKEIGEVYNITSENYYELYKLLKEQGLNVSLFGRKIRLFLNDNDISFFKDKYNMTKSTPSMEDVFVYYAKGSL